MHLILDLRLDAGLGLGSRGMTLALGLGRRTVIAHARLGPAFTALELLALGLGLGHLDIAVALDLLVELAQ